MAKTYQLNILREGIEAWNAWRREYPEVVPDLRRAHLTGAMLAGADLCNANLSYAFLEEAVLDRCNLVHTNLRHARLNQASLKKANLNNATLRQALLVETRLDEATLRGTDLRHADLERSNLFKTNLEHADVSEANLSHAILWETVLKNAALDRSRFDHAKLFNVSLRSASLRHARFHEANLSQVSLDRADVSHARFDRTEFDGVSMKEARLASTMLHHIKLAGTNLEYAEFSGTYFIGVDLTGAQGLTQSVHLSPSDLDEQTLEVSEQIPEAFLRGAGLAEDRLMVYLYCASLSIGLTDPGWAFLPPVDAALKATLDGHYRIERREGRIVVRLQSQSQFQGALNAVVPVIAALNRRARGAISHLEVDVYGEERLLITGRPFQEAMTRLSRIFDELTAGRHEDDRVSTFLFPDGIAPESEEESASDSASFDVLLHDWFDVVDPSIPPRCTVIYDHFVHILSRLEALIALRHCKAAPTPKPDLEKTGEIA